MVKQGTITHKTATTPVMMVFAILLSEFFVGSASANFKPYQSPELVVLSPSQNAIYKSPDVQLNVTIKLLGWYLGSDLNKEELKWFNYSLDGHTGSTIPVLSVPGNYFPNPVFNGTGKSMLSGLSDGKHWLEVKGETSFNATFTSGLVFFTVDANPNPEPRYNITVRISSPIQNQTYYSNNVPLNFTLDTNIDASNTEGVVFVYNLDGQLGYHDGHGTRIGEYYPPISSFYSTIMNVPDGNHLLWVQVDYYTNDPDFLGHPAESLSQIVNFTVSAGTVTPSETPASTEEHFPWLPVAAVSVVAAVLIGVIAVVYLRRHRASDVGMVKNP